MNQKLLLLLGIPVIVLGFAFQTPAYLSVGDEQSIEVPEAVQVILNKSCTPCHSDEARAFKAKSALNFDKLASMTTSKKVNKLLKIADKVSEGKMPKKKFVNKHPEAALTADEKTMLIDWANKQADALVGE